MNISDIKPNIPVTFVDNPGHVPRKQDGFLLKPPDSPLCGRPMRLTGHWRPDVHNPCDHDVVQVECMGVLRGEHATFWMQLGELRMVN